VEDDLNSFIKTTDVYLMSSLVPYLLITSVALKQALLTEDGLQICAKKYFPRF
jgi:hypothetical protein